MSLILEALKKSEAERQRGATPTIFTPTVQDSFDKRSSLNTFLPWLLLILLAAALIVAAIWFYQGKTSKTADLTQLPPQTASEPALPADPSEKVTPFIQPTPVPIPIPSPSQTPPPAASNPQLAESTPPSSAATPAPAATEEIVRTPDVAQDDALPLSMLSSEQRQQLPPMKYSMHVFAESSQDRFAILDGNRVTAGSLLGPAVVAEIRRDGVVIDWNGTRYLVAKP
jgi:general secretion pathway protein B